MSSFSPISGASSSSTSSMSTTEIERENSSIYSASLADVIFQSFPSASQHVPCQISASHLNPPGSECYNTKTIENDDNDQLSKMQKGLSKWCEEVKGTQQYSSREEIAKQILDCYKNNSTTLSLIPTEITSLPDEIGSLRALKKLVICGSGLKSLPSSIGNLAALETLYIGPNSLSSLPSSIGNLGALKKLSMSSNKLTTLPSSIGNLKALWELSIGANMLTTLPDEIGKLAALKRLMIGANELTTLPDAIGNLQKLQKLTIGPHNLTTLPSSIRKLAALQVLSIQKARLATHSGLTTLPDEIGNLRSLKYLHLGVNQLTSLPNTIGSLAKLQNLIIDTNQLSSLPDTIGHLAALQLLSIVNGQLVSIPSSIGNLTALETLLIANNPLTSIPSTIGNLEKLTILNLDTNQLTSIPPEVGNLSALRILSLVRNRLTSLPIEFSSLPGQCIVDITGCQFSRSALERIYSTVNAEGYSGPIISYSMYEPRNRNTNKSTAALLKMLSKISGKKPDLTELLKSEQADNLKAWLNKICDIADFNECEQSQTKVATDVMDYLELAEKNKNFRDLFFAIIEHAPTTCGDRMALSIIDIGIAKKLAEVSLTDLKNLSKLLIHGVWAVDQLGKIARDKITTLLSFDEIEVYLGYLINLKKELSLPLDVDKMLYFRCSNITKEDLEAAYKKVKSNLDSIEERSKFLASQPLWRKALEIKCPEAYEKACDDLEDPIRPLAALTKKVMEEEGLIPNRGKRKLGAYLEEKKE